MPLTFISPGEGQGHRQKSIPPAFGSRALIVKCAEIATVGSQKKSKEFLKKKKKKTHFAGCHEKRQGFPHLIENILQLQNVKSQRGHT